MVKNIWDSQFDLAEIWNSEAKKGMSNFKCFCSSKSE